MELESYTLSPLLLLPAIVFVLFLHGALLTLNFSAHKRFRPILSIVSAMIMSAFLCSLFVNLILFVGLSLLEISIWNSIWILGLFDALLLAGLIRQREPIKQVLRDISVTVAEKGLFLLVAVMAIIMGFNGGLIDVLADSWWHMSLASRIAEDGSIFSLKHHLIGFPTTKYQFDYTFLWHASLALINQVSGLSLPVIWHAIAPYTVSLSILGFFLFALALTKDQGVALLSSVLFCLLYGAINSYFRVSPWPGNVSYIGMYFCLYLYFSYLDHLPAELRLKQIVRQAWPYLVYFLITVLCMAALHGVALILLIISIALFIYGALIFSLVHPSLLEQAKVARQLLILLPILLAGFIMAGLMFSKHIEAAVNRLNDIAVLEYTLLLLLPALLSLLLRLLNKNPGMGLRLSVFLLWAVGMIWYSMDWSHFIELFFPPETISGREIPRRVTINEFTVLLPNWIHQLRGGLLFSALLSIPVSLLLLWIRKDISSLFLSANATIAGLALSSPMLFWIVTVAIQNTSSYRIQALIFHPIIYALMLTMLFTRIRAK